MKKRDRMERDRAAGKAELLCEALPWINKMSGKTFVIKYGGSAMEDPELCRQVVADIEMLKLMGVRIVLVHGGGKAINAMLKRLDVSVKFKDGLRVTDDETMEAVQEVLVGHVNQQLVWALNEYGHNAVGISGADGKTLKAEPVDPDLGKIAEAMGADKLIYLTDVDGLFRDFSDEDSLVAQLTRTETHELLESGALDGGMIPKIRSVAEALDAGVSEVVILNGTYPHSLLLEIFTDAGCGTMFTQD